MLYKTKLFCVMEEHVTSYVALQKKIIDPMSICLIVKQFANV